ncbi:MAG TPA: class I SAM-dependent methyltransferase [Candidatus Nanoarchaeia archaeon]|nr:class I SAM-dependent methyltransferase [Candidatus Nanoarchaeia archaeon]
MIGDFFIIKNKIKNFINSEFNDKNDEVLDLGCGSNPYYHKGIKGKIVCLDISKTSKTHLVSDADRLPFRPNSFDKVISVNSFYYFKNPFEVAKSTNKILKKEGKLILVVPFFYPIHDAPDDKYRFTEYGLKTVLEEDFKIERIEAIGGIFNLPAVLLHSLIKGIPLLFPKEIRKFVQILAYVLWPVYIIAQIFSILDIFDLTKRFPTYYFVVAGKK